MTQSMTRAFRIEITSDRRLGLSTNMREQLVDYMKCLQGSQKTHLVLVQRALVDLEAVGAQQLRAQQLVHHAGRLPQRPALRQCGLRNRPAESFAFVLELCHEVHLHLLRHTEDKIRRSRSTSQLGRRQDTRAMEPD